MNVLLDNILSRLGIYDLMGVLYTGTIISVTLWFINDLFNIVNFQFEALDVNGTFLFIVQSNSLRFVTSTAPTRKIDSGASFEIFIEYSIQYISFAHIL